MRRTFLPSECHSAFERYLAMITLSLALLLGISMQSLQAQVDVTATAGVTGPTTYATVNAAFAAINLGTHQGAITITVTASTTETVPPTPLLASGGTSSYTNILLTCTGNVTINSAATPTASRGIIELLGADNVTIDGDDAGTSGTRNLTFQMATTTNTGTQCIRLASNSTTGLDGANNNTVRNCNLIGGRSTAVATTSSWGILMSNTTAVTTGAYSSLNTLIENNAITRCYTGIGAIGVSATYPNTGTIIRNNVIGSSTATDNIGSRGIFLSYTSATAGALSALVERNDIRVGDVSASGTGYSVSIAGIEVGTVNAGLKISRNNIHDILQPTTLGYGAFGILISGAASCNDIEISNNFINNVVGSKYTTTSLSSFVAYGIRYSAGATLQKINYNTIVLPNTVTGTTVNYVTYAVAAGVSGVTISEFQNNIIVNQNVGTGTFGFYCNTTTNISAGVVNYNDYLVPSGNVGYYNAAARTTLGDWQTATGKDANSISADPGFTSGTDLHIDLSNPNAVNVNALATPISTIVDYDGDSRDGSTPDMGADEFILLPCNAANGGTITPGTITRCSGQTYTMTSVGAETGLGITYQWEISAFGAGLGFSDVGGATATSYTTAALAVGVYYYRLRVNCSFGPVVGYSNELMITVNPTPTASAGNSGPICPGSNLDLSSSTDIGTTYLWSGPNSFSSILQNPSIAGATNSAAGTYTVTVTSGGCSATASTVATVLAPVSASASATPTTVCNNGSSQLNAVGSAASGYNMSSTTFGLLTAEGTVTNTATGDDALLNTVALPFNFSFFGTSYSNILVYSNGYVAFQTGVTGSPYVQTIPDGAAPNNFIAISHDDLNVQVAGQLSYFTNGVSPNRIFVINYNGVKYYNTAANNGNLSGQIQIFEADQHIEIHVQNSVDPVLSAKSLGIENAAGTVGLAPATRNNLSYDITTPEAWSFAPNAFSYAWSESPSLPVTLSDPTIANPLASSITVAKTYSVTITETFSGCSNTASVVVTPSAPITSATITPASPSFCTGGSVTLTATPDNGGGPFTYTWADPSNNPAGTAATQVANVGGTWTVTVSDNCGGSVTVTTTVTENAIPTASANSNSPVCVGSPLNLSVTTDIGTTYLWAGPNTFSSTLQSPSIASATLAAAGTYTVTVTSIGSCTATSSTVVTIVSSPVITSTTATPNSICPGENSQLEVNLAAPAAYCASAFTSVTFEFITNVTYAGINNTSAGTLGGPVDYTAQVANVTAGGTDQISVTIDPDALDYVYVWIDWDQNGILNDGGETYTVIASTSLAGPHLLNITVPVTALSGNTRMRVMLDYNNAVPNPCRSASFGEAEDYTVNVTGGVAAATYSWSPALFLNNADIANPLASAVTSTTPYTVTVTNGAGCTATGTTTVTVNPTVSAGSINGISPLCVGATNTYTSTGTSGGTWSSSDDLVATVDSGSGLVTAIGAGSATITYTVNTGCGSPVSQFFTVNVIANTSNTTTVSVCDTYTWLVNGMTYTTSGTYTSVTGCHTEILDLTITPSTSNTTTISVCDTYTWGVNGATYTMSGTYTSVSGCHTEILDLTITASTSNTTTISACDTYTWPVNGTTYTGSDTYTFVSGCHTEILNLTIITSTSNTTTQSACDTYTWPVNGATYTASGTYTSVTGCHTEILDLTIIPGTSNTTTVTDCFQYYWDVTGIMYTSSGTYTNTVGCFTEILNLTIEQCTFNFIFAFTDPCTCNNNATLAANDGTFTEIAGVPFVSQNGSIPEDFVVTVLSSTGTTGLVNGTELLYNDVDTWETGPFTHVDNMGYTIVFEVRAAVENGLGLDGGTLVATVTGTNKCAYPNPAVSGLASSYCTSGSGGVPDTDISAILTGSPTGPSGTFTLSGTDLSGGPVTYTFTPPAAVGSSTVDGSYTGGDDQNGGVSPDGGTTPAFPGCIQPFSATTNIVDCPPGCNASPNMQWDN